MTTQRDDMAGLGAADPAPGQADPPEPMTGQIVPPPRMESETDRPTDAASPDDPAADPDRVVLDDPVQADDRAPADDTELADDHEPADDPELADDLGPADDPELAGDLGPAENGESEICWVGDHDVGGDVYIGTIGLRGGPGFRPGVEGLDRRDAGRSLQGHATRMAGKPAHSCTCDCGRVLRTILILERPVFP